MLTFVMIFAALGCASCTSVAILEKEALSFGGYGGGGSDVAHQLSFGGGGEGLSLGGGGGGASAYSGPSSYETSDHQAAGTGGGDFHHGVSVVGGGGGGHETTFDLTHHGGNGHSGTFGGTFIASAKYEGHSGVAHKVADGDSHGAGWITFGSPQYTDVLGAGGSEGESQGGGFKWGFVSP